MKAKKLKCSHPDVMCKRETKWITHERQGSAQDLQQLPRLIEKGHKFESTVVNGSRL